mgnify:CR=1 FL=1
MVDSDDAAGGDGVGVEGGGVAVPDDEVGEALPLPAAEAEATVRE